MEWLLFTYWLPPEPSRKRVYVWRQLKKTGALLVEGGWLLPDTEETASTIRGIMKAVEEMGGTASLYTVKHATGVQEQRAIERFRQERTKEYSEIVNECRKALKHIEWESERGEFNFEEVEELEGDLEKIRRWYNEIKKRDMWDCDTARSEVEKLISEIEKSLTDFTRTTCEKTSGITGSEYDA